MNAMVRLIYPKLTPMRRYDGRWIVLSRNEVAKLFSGDADHKRFTVNNYIPILREIVKEGDTVIDIGASYGDEVIDLSVLVGPAGKIIAFEPDKSSFASLEATVAANNLSNVECVNAFVSDKGTTVDGHWREGLNCGPVKLLKIDTDGHELAVLRGARKMLESNPSCVVLAEYLPALRYEKRQGAEVLREYVNAGFKISAIRTAIVPLEPADLEEKSALIGSEADGYCHDIVLTR